MKNDKGFMTIEECDRFIQHCEILEDAYYKIGKTFCRHAKAEGSKAHDVFVKFCNFCDCSNSFVLKYVNQLPAEKVAELEHIDRRTVFKQINNDYLIFGEWLVLENVGKVRDILYSTLFPEIENELLGKN